MKALAFFLVYFLFASAGSASPFLKFGKPVAVGSDEYGRFLSDVHSIEDCPIVDNTTIDFAAFETVEHLEICMFYLANALGSVAQYEKVMRLGAIAVTHSRLSEFTSNAAYNRPGEHVYSGVYKGAVHDEMQFAMRYKTFWYRPKIFWIYVVWDKDENPLDVTVKVPGWFTS
jgi:hypothetical protein